MELNNKVILITGGTGSFGRKFVEIVLKKYKPQKLIIFSRDEYKQHFMQKQFNQECVRYFLGDVRDEARLKRSMHGVDVVVHAAALKQVPALEYNPFEAIKTNVIGAENIINAAIYNKVKRVIAISSDKAVNPINLYGATKLCGDKLFINGNVYSGDARTIFSVVRYGNVFGSRGSVVELFMALREKGLLPITDHRMTRFWITLEQGVNFVLKCLKQMHGGEIFVPKLPSIKILDLANAVAPGCKTKVIGIRPGEKLHELLLNADDARRAVEKKDMYVLLPNFVHLHDIRQYYKKDRVVQDRFVYASDTNTVWLSLDELRKMIKKHWA